MRKNDIFLMKAENLGADMEGVCRHEGMTVFVPGLLPGEETPVRIVKAEKNYAFGRMEQPPALCSPDRASPGCPAFPRCGGCTCRHLKYEATLAAKRQHVEDCFSRIGKISLEVPPLLGMESPRNYRNKTALPIGGTADSPVLGFYAPRSHQIIPAADCPNAALPSADITHAVADWIRKYHISPWNETEGRGLLRHLVIRVSREGKSMVTLVSTSPRLPGLDDLSKALRALNVVSLYLNIHPKPTNVIFSNRFHLIYGEETLNDTLCGLSFQLSPDSFFQINPPQTEKLYETALDFAGLSPEDTLCDVYCGAGTITLMMARRCKSAIGIEVVPAAVANAKKNAERNGISNAVFREGTAESLLPRLVNDGLRPDVIVVDPPRKGLDSAVVSAIIQAAPSTLVYISCNPATQARDAAFFLEGGYRVQKIQPVDMFPYTSHVETVMSLVQQKPDDIVKVGIDADELAVTKAESKATYGEIQARVKEQTGLNVTPLYIAQVKRKYGIIERECYNKAKSESAKMLICPPDKEKAIEDALRFFGMIA